jgi:hypothetical protein
LIYLWVDTNMAIQQVGNRGVYVITGSGRDPRLTSNGQSWADLVTQQKYMLIKEAQKEALRRIDLETKDYAARQEAYQQVQKDIRSQIDKAQSDIAAIKLKETEAQQRLNEQQQKALIERSKGTKITTRSGSGGGSGSRGSREMTGAEYIKALQNDVQQNQAIADKAEEKAKTVIDDGTLRGMILARKPEAFTPEQTAAYQKLDTNAQSRINSAMDAQARVDESNRLLSEYSQNAQNPEAQRQAIQKYQNVAPSTSATGGSGGSYSTQKIVGQTDLPETPTVDYSNLIKPLEDRIKMLESQALGMELPTKPTSDATSLMRQVAAEDYGLRSSYRPEVQPVTPVDRTAEMQALDVSPMPPTSQPPVPFRMEQGVSGGVGKQEYLGGLDFTEVADPRIVPQDTYVADPRIVPQVQNQNELLSQPLSPTPTPTPTPRPQPSVVPQGDVKSIFDRLLKAQEPQAQPKVQDIFMSVQYATPEEKKQMALQAIMQKAQELGSSNPAYIKAKEQILDQLQRVLDPQKYKQMKLVEKNQTENKGDYYALSKSVRGLQEKNAQLTYSLFPVNEQTKPEEADQFYKNAQKQIQQSIADSFQRKKAQEFLDLMYLAYMNEK